MEDSVKVKGPAGATRNGRDRVVFQHSMTVQMNAREVSQVHVSAVVWRWTERRLWKQQAQTWRNQVEKCRVQSGGLN